MPPVYTWMCFTRWSGWRKLVFDESPEKIAEDWEVMLLLAHKDQKRARRVFEWNPEIGLNTNADETELLIRVKD